MKTKDAILSEHFRALDETIAALRAENTRLVDALRDIAQRLGPHARSDELLSRCTDIAVFVLSEYEGKT